MTTYTTLTGSLSTDGKVTMHDDGSYYRVVHGEPLMSVHQCLMTKDLDKCANMSTMMNEDGAVIGLHYNEQHRHADVWISNGCGEVVVTPGHPHYALFPQQEEEVSPCGQMGKIIAKWDLTEKPRINELQF